MSLYYSLARDISGEKLLQDIVNMITKFRESGGDIPNSILVCEIQTVSEYSGDSLLPKIEHKIIDCPT